MSSIAHQFGVNVGTILWNNKLTEHEYIRPGDALRIPPVSGIIATIKSGDTISKLAKRYGAEAQEIMAFNNLDEETKLTAGTDLVIPGGRPPELEQTRTRIVINTKPTPSSGASAIRNVNVPKPADLDTKALPTTRLLWPTSGRVVTQYYGWKHTGIDIDGDYSSPIYASADGIVEKAGWNSGGYGLMILINHPGGVVTRYAHASKMFVKAGDTVKKGQVIAMVGTTGRSTGTHLHYEVYVKDKRTNPLGYIR
jgi:murein DD-endopeptidase MepM/ murein hydrolase activator NlpD